ncbi:MAG TPA: ABC transporter, partial [Armatimonadetes bacterium]|nr:ABC transporter [Armatimonadota bacterium]
MSEAVRCDGVDFAYNGTRVLQDVTFGVAAGEFIGLIGANGSGKSTLLRLLLGMLTPTAGRIEVLGQAPLAAVRGGFVGYVPQRDARASSTPLSAYDVVLLGRARCVGLGRRPRAAD